MKRNGIRRITGLVLALVLALLCAAATAEQAQAKPAATSETVAKLLQVWDFKFHVRDVGIGTGTAPVYTAPSKDSIRLSDGKASCSLAAEIAVAGYTNHWLMVRYEIKDKKVRVGYIPPENARGVVAEVGALEFDSIPVTLAEAIDISDNCRDNSTPFGTLEAGSEITILGKYTYSDNWWYVEAKLDGQLTRGFIDRNTASLVIDGVTYTGNAALGTPVKSPEGQEQTGTVTINGNGDNAMIVRKRADLDAPMVARVYGTETFPCYGAQPGPRSKDWYLIWVDGVWGWISSGVAEYTE